MIIIHRFQSIRDLLEKKTSPWHEETKLMKAMSNAALAKPR